MQTDTIYFYLNNTTKVKNENNGLFEEFYSVVKVPIFNNNIDRGERKARTIAKRLGLGLAGGYFVASAKPYDFKRNYKVYNCPKNTKIQPYTTHDKFIINLIENS